MVDLNSRLGALFDLDGVLIDSEGIYTDFWSGIDAIYPTGIKDFALVIKGCTLPYILDTYFPEQEKQQRIKQLLEEHEQLMEYRLFDGVYGFVSELKTRGIPMAIVTSSTRLKMSHMVEQLPDFAAMFTDIITSEDVCHGKPDSEGYLIGAKRIGIAPENCIVFEDSINGLKAGRAAGAYVVAIATTNSSSLLKEYGDAVIDRLRPLYVDQLFK